MQFRRTHHDAVEFLQFADGTVRARLRAAKRIANPGCHATAFILLLRPLIDAGLLPGVIQDARTEAVLMVGFFSRESLAATLEREPHRFSPNVQLRPLTQQVLLPVAAQIGGPAEVAYFAMLNEKGGVEGYKIEAIYADAQSKPDVAINEAVRLMVRAFERRAMQLYGRPQPVAGPTPATPPARA